MDPLKEYTARRDRWRAEHGRLQREFIRIGNWRLAVAGAGAALAYIAIGRHAVSAWWLLAPVGGFVALVVWHQRVLRGRTLAERAIRFYERGMARLHDAWMGNGNAGEQFRDAAHVYSEDLDVFGKGSLFELTATARTSSGEQTLADWFRRPTDREEALARQEAVRELTGQLDLREDIALLGEDVRAEVHEKAVEAWGSAARVVFAPYLRVMAAALAVLALATLIAFLARAIPVSPFAAVLGCNFVLVYVLRSRVREIMAAAEIPGHELGTFSQLVKRLEGEQFEAPRLQNIGASLHVEGWPASKRIARLERWMDLLASEDHLIIRLIRAGVLWREQVAMGIETWRAENGEHVGRWVKAVADFEALSSLASLKFERPQWIFPELLDGEARLEAQDLQHPLMAPSHCVPNDVAMGGARRLLIVSGSNMSGKSTLLRAIGLNTVLARAGGPVAAKRMGVSPLHVGASIRVIDSLQENRSRFFAEITRIRRIMELTGAGQTLFLLDELLSGTNSHDRRIGATGIVRALVDAGAIGLITTHDLALAEIENDLGRAAVNVHFDDQIVDGRIEFDFRLRPGVVTRSNALELMRAIGLEV
jgi:hypothetical protein